MGSVPNDPDYDRAEMYTRSESWFSSYNGKFKETDQNYKSDYDKMTELNIIRTNKKYWLASRYLNSSRTYNIMLVSFIGTRGDLNPDPISLCEVYESGKIYAGSNTMGLRVAFNIKSGVKVIEGKGTASSPYELEG